MSNPNNSGNIGFQSLLYYLLIIKKKYPVKWLASELGIAEDTLYKYVQGRNLVPPDRIADLIRITKDFELMGFFLDRAGFFPAPKAEGPAGKGDTLPHILLQLSIRTGQAQEAIEQALADGKVEKLEYKKIRRLLLQLQAEAAGLQAKIGAEVKG